MVLQNQHLGGVWNFCWFRRKYVSQRAQILHSFTFRHYTEGFWDLWSYPIGKIFWGLRKSEKSQIFDFWAEISELLGFKSVKLWGFQISATFRKVSCWRVTIIPKTSRGMTLNSNCAKSWVQRLHALLQISKSSEPANTSKITCFEQTFA